MNLRKRAAAIAAGALVAAAAVSGTAQAAFPDFADCPAEAPGVVQCLHLQSTGGSLGLGQVDVPLGDSLQIRGGIVPAAPFSTVVGPGEGSALVSAPVAVPGGLFGTALPLRLNRLSVAFEPAAGAPVQLNRGSLAVRLAVKLKLTGPLVGPNCRIGTDAEPIQLTLPRTTAGELVYEDAYFAFVGNEHADTAFATPGARGCGFGGSLNDLVDWRFGTPAASGEASLTVQDDLALTY